MGLVLSSAYSEATNIYSHHNMEQGILLTGNYAIADRCRVYYNAMRNEHGRGYPNGGWGTGISAARGLVSYAIIRNCIIWNNWGEGLSTFEADHTTMEDNIVYDNHTNVYISDATNVLCQRNLIYTTTGSVVTVGSRAGIMMGDESHNPSSTGNVIINNMVVGNRLNFYWWSNGAGDGLKNTTIANNTFINSALTAGVYLSSGSHSNSQFRNNIIAQEGLLKTAIIETATGIAFSNNLWSNSAPANGVGPGDVTGDALLSKAGQILPAELKPDYFKISAESPARNSGIALPNVKEDYFGSPRGNQPDIGAHEFNPDSNGAPAAPVALKIIQNPSGSQNLK